jgi:hypothetical protein
MPGENTTIGAILGFLGGLGAFLSIPALLARRPTYGPRLEPGELKAGKAASLAEKNYWQAEQSAAKGDCNKAALAWSKAEGYRRMARERAAKGDRTGYDLREAVREARDEIRRQKCKKIPQLNKAQHEARVQELERQGCRVIKRHVPGVGIVVLRQCPGK